jgi:hypothetical protein
MPFISFWKKNQLIILMLFVILSCKNESKEDINLDGLDGQFQLIRFDKEIFAIDTNKFSTSFLDFKNKYPALSEIYLRNIIQVDSIEEMGFMRGFITNSTVKKLVDTTNLILPNLDLFKKEMESHLKHIKYYFKGYESPKVYTVISEYSIQQFIFDDAGHTGIGVGLDMFLGGSYPYKNIDPTNPSFSDYLVRSYDQRHMSSKVLNLIIDDLLANEYSTSPKLIDKIINNGKRLYLKEKLAPDMKRDVLFELKSEQVKWMEENELEIWSFLLDNNLLYETTPMKVNRYVNPAPTSPNMPAEAPGGAANYIGYMIVKSACKKIDWKEVMKMDNGQQLLEQSNYKPKR